MTGTIDLDTNPPELPCVLFSVSPDYFDAARYEIRSAIPKVEVEHVGPDAGLVSGISIEIGDLVDLCRANRLHFVRHLAAIESIIEVRDGALSQQEIVNLAIAILRRRLPSSAALPVSLQLWASGFEPSSESQRPDVLRRALVSCLSDAGWNISRSGSPFVLSVVLTKGRIYLGFNRSSDALVDWPGGRVGLAKTSDRISRSEFKLEELFQTFDLGLTGHGSALDLGASPGGWTRIMRKRGYRVTTVDPARLDARLEADPNVEQVASTAGWYLSRAEAQFDAVLNDMRMPVELSIETMLRARRLLTHGGLLIMTLKLGSGRGGKQVIETVERSLRELESDYQIRFARQLFHNRHEVTIVARNRD